MRSLWPLFFNSYLYIFLADCYKSPLLWYSKFHLSMAGHCWYWRGDYLGRLKPPYNIQNFMYHWPSNCWWWRFPCPCSHTHIYIFMYILILMSNNLVNQSTKAISTNELRWIGPVLAVVSSGPMDLFFIECDKKYLNTELPGKLSLASSLRLLMLLRP